jgi:CoA:oxalate CoA-transferase
MNKEALSGLKVVEYSQFVSGPYCGKLLADLGAEVIKVEEPGLGDKARSWGPFPKDTPHPEKSGLFLFLNTNKLGVTLNLRTAMGVKIFRELAKRVDVVVASNPPQEMKRLGLDYESLHKINPGLVMTSITPFGQTGPYRDYKGCDLITFNMSGEAYINPAEGVDDIEQKPPLKGPMHAGDFATGLTGAIGTISAVIARMTSGLGQQVDLSQQEALASTVRTELFSYLYEGIPPSREKSKIGRRGAMTTLFRCKDGHIMISAIGGGGAFSFWPALVGMMGNPGWTKEEWCQDDVKRRENLEKINQKIAEWMGEHTIVEISEAVIATRIPYSPVRTVRDLVSDEQLAARDFFVEIDHPYTGKLKYPGAPYKLSATPWIVKRPAPLLGEHNEQIYCQMLGYTRQDLVKMRQAGVV